MKRRSTQVIAALVIVGALVAAVGAGAQTKADPIKLMVIAPVATPIENYPDAQAGAEAAAAAINKAGGINGQQVQISFCNTQSNPNVAQACARQAVSEKVAAVIGIPGTQSTLVFPILQPANIPVVGARSQGNVVDWLNPMSFPFSGGSASNYQGVPFALKTLGKKRFFVFYQDVPSAAVNAKNTIRAAKIAGLPVVGSSVLPGGTTDFAPFVQKLREVNPDTIVFINSPGVSGALMRSAEALGLKPLWVHNSGSIGEPEAAQIGAPAEGMLLAGDFPSFRDAKLYKGIQHFLADMKAAGKESDPVNVKVTGVSGWLDVYAIKAVAASIKGPVTNVSLLKAMRAQTKPLNVEGLISWTPGKKGPAALPRWPSILVYFMTIKNGQQVAWGKNLPPIDIIKAQKFVR